MKILILIFFFEIKESKITRGHNYTLVKKQSRLDVRKYSFHRGPSIYGITYQQIVYRLVVLICSRSSSTDFRDQQWQREETSHRK